MFSQLGTDHSSGQRTYTLYIMYTPYYRTPRLYLSGYTSPSTPLPPALMMDDIVGDYKDKTVTLEDFPFFSNPVKMASVHPCKHASVMKTLLDRADAALRIRRDKMKHGQKVASDPGMEVLVEEVGRLDVKGAQEEAEKDEWEEVKGDEVDDQEVAIRVDQYLVVFLKVCSILLPAFTYSTDIIGSSWPASHPASSTTSQWASRPCCKGNHGPP